jgi:bifunctional non-homologous end joining protein LigD
VSRCGTVAGATLSEPMAKSDHTMLDVAGREVRLSSPAKVYFPKPGWTKLDLVEYYVTVADAALVHVRGRPTVMKRFVNGILEEPIWQKRVPQKIPEWLQTATVAFPSGRTAEELVVGDAAHMVWAVNLGVIDFNPWPARRGDLDHPDELRVDLDPTPGIVWDAVRRTAMVVRDVLSEQGLRGYPKTSGSKGIHVNVRIEPRWDFLEVRRSALALAREVERRAPDLATSKWWKEERHGVFVDYNQNARDRTVASGYSVRPTPDARVSCALNWDEVPDVEPGDLRLDTVPERSAIRPPTSTSGPAPSTGCSSWPAATRRRASGTHRGRRTSRSGGASRSASSRAVIATVPPSAVAPATHSPAAHRPACGPAASSGATAPSQGPARGTRTSSTTEMSGYSSPKKTPAQPKVAPLGYAAATSGCDSATRTIRPAAPSSAPAERSAAVAFATRRPASPSLRRRDTEALSSAPDSSPVIS